MSAGSDRTGGAANTAFTLVEMLVSIAALIIPILFVTQLFSGATASSTRGARPLDADEAARLVFVDNQVRLQLFKSLLGNLTFFMSR